MYHTKSIREFPYILSDTTNWKPPGYEHKVYENVLHAIGNTPLVKIHRVHKDHGLQCEMFAKCEFLNPGGSIKDRISYTMLVEALKTGRVKPCSRVVVPTSGNTGTGLALATAVNGLDCTIVTPDKNSDEKMNTMHLLGAEIVQTPAMAVLGHPENFMSVANRILSEDKKAVVLDQYSDHANPMTHYEFTAEEILSAVGTIDMIVIGAGTGGTLSGIGYKIKSKCPNCVIVAVDPKGSTIYGAGEPRPFFVEGIGGDFVPHVLDNSIADRVEQPNDRDSFNMSREIIKKEGLLCGGSSGAIMVSAIRAAQDLHMGAGKKVVVILPDGIRNYMTKFVTDQWMEAHCFMDPPPRDFLKWWNDPVSNLKLDDSVPMLKDNETCAQALTTMGSQHSVALVINSYGFFLGAVSKDSLRHEATNPKKNTNLNLDEHVGKHLIKKCHKIIINKGNPTVGLASRILDITTFVVVVEESNDENENKSLYEPKGILNADILLDYIVSCQNS